MGFFDIFKKQKDYDDIDEFDEISEFDDEVETDNFVVDMFGSICKKCDYGDSIDKLNEHERVIFITQILEGEVNNGGFSQFFYNSSGDFSNEIVDAFTKIGATKTVKICRKALSVFRGEIPSDREKREELLDHLNCDAVFDKCDNAFYEYEDDLESLNRAYIMQHRDFFD